MKSKIFLIAALIAILGGGGKIKADFPYYGPNIEFILMEDCCWKFVIHEYKNYHNDTTTYRLRLYERDYSYQGDFPIDSGSYFAYYDICSDSTYSMDTLECIFCPDVDWLDTVNLSELVPVFTYEHTNWRGYEQEFSQDYFYPPNEITTCTPCPEDEIKSEWLKLNYEEDRMCDGCAFSVEFDIPPDTLATYSYIEYQSEFPEASGIFPISSFDFSRREFCVQPGVYEVTFTLGRSADFNEREYPCTVSDEIWCSFDIATTHHGSASPCLPDCPDADFVDRDTLTFINNDCGTGCEIEAIYTWRHACDSTYQDLQVLGIYYSPECDSMCTIEDIYVSTISEIIYKNKMEFDPEFGDVGCNTQWRVAIGSCWTNFEYTYYVPYGNGRIPVTKVVNKPCDSVDCCLQPIIVCRTIDGGITIDIDSNAVNNDFTDCNYTTYSYTIQTQPWPTTVVLDCNPACDWNSLLDGVSFVGDGSVVTGKLAAEGINRDYEDCEISGYANSEELTVEIDCTREAIYDIRLYDLQGNILQSTKETANQGSNTYRISISDLPSGFYFYSVSVDDIQIHTEKIQIVK